MFLLLLRKVFLKKKYIPYIAIHKINPKLWPQPTWGLQNEQIWICTSWKWFNINVTNHGLAPLEQKIFTSCFIGIFPYKTCSHIVTPSYSQWPWFEQTLIYTTQRCLHINMIMMTLLFLKDFLYMSPCKTLPLIVATPSS